jgi:hypothetical protein
MTHFLYCPFSGLGKYDKQRTTEYWDYRVKIFEKFTLPSLLNQSNKNWTLWISFRPQDKNAEFVVTLAHILSDSQVSYVFTFNGIAMWDDRGLENNDTLLERTKLNIEELKPFIKDDWVYITSIGSDDMLAKDAVAEIQKQEPQAKKALYFLSGFIFDSRTEQLADWNRDTPCSKYTVIYPKEVILDAQKWWDYEYSCLKSHEYITTCYTAIQLPDRLYACVVHGANISTDWLHKFRGAEHFQEEDKKEILSRFGITL